MSMIEEEFVHAGLTCYVVVNSMLCTRCGYVRVPQKHPLFNVTLDKLERIAPNVCYKADGGVTFCGEHRNIPGWLIGWDGAHDWHKPDPELVAKAPAELASTMNMRSGSDYAVVVTRELAHSNTEILAEAIASFEEDGGNLPL